MPRPRRVTDDVVRGQVFTRLTVSHVVSVPRGGAKVQARCECGEVTTVYWQSLTSGRTKSCGCLGREVGASNMQKAAAKHRDNVKRGVTATDLATTVLAECPGLYPEALQWIRMPWRAL